MPPLNQQRQWGVGLPETLVAALFFAISLLGLLQYHQLMQQAFMHQWQQRLAWRVAYQQLALYATGQGDTAAQRLGQDLPHGWQLTLTAQPQTLRCRRVTATVTTPQHYQAQLDRWFC